MDAPVCLQGFYLSSEVVVKNRSPLHRKGKKNKVARAADVIVMTSVSQVISTEWRLLARCHRFRKSVAG